jgi:hypothetical protein
VAIVGDLIGLCVVGFLALAVLSIFTTKAPRTPPFARRAASSSNPQLRQDSNARFFTDRGFLFRRRHWFVATCCPPVRIITASYQSLCAAERHRPMPVAQTGGRTWWWFEGDFYWESGRYGERDVLALIRDRQRRATQRLDRAHMLLNVDEGRAVKPRGRRESIPREVRLAIFQRDGGKCAECGGTFDLQYDHIIPVALGGATSEQNLQLLCAVCNRDKGANL